MALGQLLELIIQSLLWYNCLDGIRQGQASRLCSPVEHSGSQPYLFIRSFTHVTVSMYVYELQALQWKSDLPF